MAGDDVRVNLGSALACADGWIHVDNSPNVLFAHAPTMILRRVHRFSPYRTVLEYDDYAESLRRYTFVHHSLRYGIPFETDSVDYVYSGHFLEHLDRDEGAALLRETYRVLKPGGIARLSVPDLERVIDEYLDGRREESLRALFGGAPGTRHQHRWMYDVELLQKALQRAGFADVQRHRFRSGEVPDLDKLDSRPEISLFVEARKGLAGVSEPAGLTQPDYAVTGAGEA